MGKTFDYWFRDEQPLIGGKTDGRELFGLLLIGGGAYLAGAMGAVIGLIAFIGIEVLKMLAEGVSAWRRRPKRVRPPKPVLVGTPAPQTVEPTPQQPTLEQQIEQARQELATMKAQAERLDDESLKELVIAQAEHRFRQRLQQIMDIERAS